MAQYDPETVVRNAVADTLDLPAQECGLDATLVGDLGLESLDMIDILFRIECLIPVTLPIAWMSTLLQGDLTDAEFCDERGVVTDLGLRKLNEMLPQLDPATWSGQLRVEDIPNQVTVGNLVDLVRARAGLDSATRV